MSDTIDLDAIGRDILAILRQHGLSPGTFTVNIVLSHTHFDTLIAQNPALTGRQIVSTNKRSEDLSWAIQIYRARSLSKEGES